MALLLLAVISPLIGFWVYVFIELRSENRNENMRCHACGQRLTVANPGANHQGGMYFSCRECAQRPVDKLGFTVLLLGNACFALVLVAALALVAY